MKVIPYLSFRRPLPRSVRILRAGTGRQDRRHDLAWLRRRPAWKVSRPNGRTNTINAHLVADVVELMGADSPPEMGDSSMRGFSVSLQLDDDAHAERIYAALRAAAPHGIAARSHLLARSSLWCTTATARHG